MHELCDIIFNIRQRFDKGATSSFRQIKKDLQLRYSVE